MRKIHAFGEPFGVVLGVVTGDDVDQTALHGSGTADLALRVNADRVPEFTVRSRFVTIWPGVVLVYANQRHRV